MSNGSMCSIESLLRANAQVQLRAVARPRGNLLVWLSAVQPHNRNASSARQLQRNVRWQADRDLRAHRVVRALNHRADSTRRAGYRCTKAGGFGVEGTWATWCPRTDREPFAESAQLQRDRTNVELVLGSRLRLPASGRSPLSAAFGAARFQPRSQQSRALRSVRLRREWQRHLPRGVGRCIRCLTCFATSSVAT